jgi:O-antigen/teichoic acid export membrane protein
MTADQGPKAAPTRPPETAGLSRNSLFVLLARGLELGAAYFGVVAVARYLSLEDFGSYSFVTALVASFLAISYFGTQQVLIREIARDRAHARAYLGVALTLRLSLAFAAALAVMAAALVLGLDKTLTAAVAIAAGAEVFFVLALLLRAVFQAYERMHYEPLVTAVHCLLLLAGVAAVVHFDLGFLWLMAALGLPRLGQCAAAALLAFSRLARPTFRGLAPHFKPFWRAALVIGLAVFLYQNIFRVNVLMLKWLGSLESLALFQAPHSFILQLQVIPISLATALFPVFARLVHSQPAQATALFERVFRLNLVGCAWLALNMSLFAPLLMGVVFGARYQGSAPVMAVVAWSILPLALDMLFSNLLIAVNRQHYTLYAAGGVIVLNLLLGPLIIPRLGHMGAAWLALASYSLLFLLSWRFAAMSGFSPRTAPALVRALAACLAAWGCAWALEPLTPGGWGLAARALAVQAVYLGAALALGLLRRGPGPGPAPAAANASPGSSNPSRERPAP